ncbi:MAG: GxxExxY protein [Bacteroidaceae bacterium]|jgi:GxxExxY protein|nr:GxxExxY protein [Bacteroidaceae bacterium]MDO4200565.1 GxxExxY protein [Bacteroidales bacterium]
MGYSVDRLKYKEENDLSYTIIGAIYDVYNKLGPGLLESVYEAALAYELKKRDLKVERQIEVPILYDGKRIDTDLRLDILVEDLVIVELKSVLEMKDVFYLQIDTYLKLTGKHLGLLVNFNTDDIVHSIHRRVK